MFIILDHITVSFEKQSYFIDEDAGPLKILLVLNESLSTDTTMKVSSTNGLATGKYCFVNCFII